MSDANMAVIYGVATKRLKKQVRCNPDRFPSDFMFELSQTEKDEVVTNCDHLAKLKFSPYLPYAFTEHGALMLANVLNSPRAVEVSVQIVRTSVRLREMLASHKDLALKLEEMEKKYDHRLHVVFESLKQLLAPQEKPKKPIGFHDAAPKQEYGQQSKNRKAKHSISEH
jgi:hypothetical protein